VATQCESPPPASHSEVWEAAVEAWLRREKKRLERAIIACSS
jgi:hypothetical protein